MNKDWGDETNGSNGTRDVLVVSNATKWEESSFTDTGVENGDIQMDVDRTIRKTALMAFFVVLMGAAASTSFLHLGISNDRNNKEESFYRRSSDVAKEMRSTLGDYETAASWIHACCRRWREDGFSRKDFRAVYEYIVASGLEFYAAEWTPNVTKGERPFLEKEAKVFYDELEEMEVNYTGFVAFDPAGSMKLIPSSEQEFYFPIHFLEPLENLGEVAHFDLYSSPYEKPTISSALKSFTFIPKAGGCTIMARSIPSLS